jgi:hypothetical protein
MVKKDRSAHFEFGKTNEPAFPHSHFHCAEMIISELPLSKGGRVQGLNVTTLNLGL